LRFFILVFFLSECRDRQLQETAKALIRPLPFHRAPMQYQVELKLICNFDPSIKKATAGSDFPRYDHAAQLKTGLFFNRHSRSVLEPSP
jgi:hypothetical protein